MNLVPVSSSNIAAIGYDEGSMTLTVEFLSGTLYQYFDVSSQVYQELMAAGSVGTYFSQNIRNNYRYTKL